MSSGMQRPMNMGKQLQLTGNELIQFIEKHESKCAAEIEMEERGYKLNKRGKKRDSTER